MPFTSNQQTKKQVNDLLFRSKLFSKDEELLLQALFSLFGGDLLHSLSTAFDAAVLAGTVYQYLDHSAALFANYYLIHIFTSLLIKSFKQANDLIDRIEIAIFHISRHTRAQMIFENIGRQAFDRIFGGSQLDKHVVAVRIVFDHLGNSIYLSAYPV